MTRVHQKSIVISSQIFWAAKFEGNKQEHILQGIVQGDALDYRRGVQLEDR